MFLMGVSCSDLTGVLCGVLVIEYGDLGCLLYGDFNGESVPFGVPKYERPGVEYGDLEGVFVPDLFGVLSLICLL